MCPIPRQVASGKWRVASGEWRVASGEWRVASGEWRVASGEWRAALCGQGRGAYVVGVVRSIVSLIGRVRVENLGLLASTRTRRSVKR